MSKGIESPTEQIRLHEDKFREAQEEGLDELADYYKRELDARKKTLKERREMLGKQ